MYNFESNPQYRFANEHGANATEVTSFGNYPQPSGKKFRSKYDLTEKELHAYHYEKQRKIWDAQDFFESQGIDMYRNLSDR